MHTRTLYRMLPTVGVIARAPAFQGLFNGARVRLRTVADRVAVVAPGGGYGADGPLLMFSAVAARRRAAMVRRLAWDIPRGGDASAAVPATVAAALGEGDYGAAVVFGKSLGSLAAAVVAEQGACCAVHAVAHQPGRRGGAAPCHRAVPAGRGSADEYGTAASRGRSRRMSSRRRARTTGCSCLAGWPPRRPCSGT